VATERLAEFRAMHPGAGVRPDPSSVFTAAAPERGFAIAELLRSRLSGLGPVSVAALADDFGLPQRDLEAALLALQAEGYAMLMAGAAPGAGVEAASVRDRTWCERRLLARIHRYSRERRRKAARPVAPAAYMRFLLDWHGLGQDGGKANGELEQALAQLEGWTAPVIAWEQGCWRGAAPIIRRSGWTSSFSAAGWSGSGPTSRDRAPSSWWRPPPWPWCRESGRPAGGARRTALPPVPRAVT
jgi:ATP-dependent helicase Lhr and Lhr-like helicase